MYIKHCKLPKNKQIELMKYFIAGSTARTAADLTEIQPPDSSINYVKKLL
ncbi:Transposase [Piscirickettsia salmonis]|uniref:Transposase n=1 Tax=Piscirickettsia salmonis TaxID=1238 RepID=A0A9Q6PU36_PISSA|nr:transposase [Piscirickettsia salmonis]QGN94858.1 Transposase [Piscirickettsia salmonis]QGO06191.1 Transposase [Piscirickettsia salmonis]QGO34517.1 Transposase [Piscirickettsia salmonis]QGO38123.1 Transposase [Piscirickettsia salmonis]